jgi:hypothetical protein
VTGVPNEFGAYARSKDIENEDDGESSIGHRLLPPTASNSGSLPESPNLRFLSLDPPIVLVVVVVLVLDVFDGGRLESVCTKKDA